MQKYAIYYSKKKIFQTIIIMMGGMALGIFLIISNSVLVGLFVFFISGILSLPAIIKKFKNKEPIIEFSDNGITTEGEFIEWKFIKKIFLKQNRDAEATYLELSIEYTNTESIEDYKTEQKEIENGGYNFNQEEFDNIQRLRRKSDSESGIKNTYFEYFHNEADANDTFEKNTKIESNEIKLKAEIYYDNKTIGFEDADKNEEEIKKIFSIFKNKVNKKLP